MGKQLILHAVELLNYQTLVVVLLDLFVSCDAHLKQRVQKVLNNLPEQKEVVALRNQEVHVKKAFLLTRHVVKLLETCLVLERNLLVDVQHFQHQFLNLLHADDLERFIK